MNINILVFEDSPAKLESFKELLALKLEHELNFTLSIVLRVDDSMLDSDIMTSDFHLILIDDDLGDSLKGDEIIEKIVLITDTDPAIMNVPKIYYSAGTSVEELKHRTKKFGAITCVSYEDLVDCVFDRIVSKYNVA